MNDHHKGRRIVSDIVKQFLIEEGYMSKKIDEALSDEDKNVEEIVERAGYYSPQDNPLTRQQYLELVSERIQQCGSYSLKTGAATTPLGVLGKPSTNGSAVDFDKTHSGPFAFSSHDIDPKESGDS